MVTCLQFQDMTSQLVVRTMKRIDGVGVLLGQLGLHGNHLVQRDEQENIVTFLSGLHQSIQQQSDALSGGLRKAVAQESLDAGDVELF